MDASASGPTAAPTGNVVAHRLSGAREVAALELTSLVGSHELGAGVVYDDVMAALSSSHDDAPSPVDHPTEYLRWVTEPELGAVSDHFRLTTGPVPPLVEQEAQPP